MIILKSNDRNPNFKFLFFIKIATFIILSWIYPYYNNQNAISKSLENGCELNISLDVRTHRSLAKSKQENELGNIRPNHKTSNYGENHKVLYINDNKNNNNTYEKVKRVRPNHMETYLKSYNSRYTKEKGIKKLDCYCEKKIFKSMYKISKLAEQKNISKSRIKRIIFTKYGFLFFIISSLPLLAFAIPRYDGTMHSLVKCKAQKKSQGEECKIVHEGCEYADIVDNSYRFIYIFFSTIIILLFIIYIFIKIMKYNRIKSGMLK
ncbi:hypothetical protein PVBG_06235 [Plasmodium vivax Brazil I]|uniref:Variable surface protein Vir35 n=1 Tax=Plasmodium vivax (strain Brazil I) TaxID=1033975 RepID=A0A0J9SXV2_PLAV1|nr:hypothetical protein PVBG_06235 [Plasmodium vivax Brazil I]